MLRTIPLSQPFLSALEAKYVSLSVDSGWLTQSGEYVEKMERAIGERLSQKNESRSTTTTSNGTTALHLVLMSLGVGPGDEVIVPDFGYIAPINSVLMCGATPVTVDVELETWCIDPHRVKNALTDKTKAVIAIDNYGALANICEIKKLIPSYIPVIEDAAESFPSLHNSRHQMFSGDFITTSFYANKIVTSAEGGSVTGPRSQIEKIQSLKNQSVKGKGTFEHIDIGYNYRISNLHAALFNAQWERLSEIIENRIRVFDYYYLKLAEFNIAFASNQYPNYINPWLMTVQLKNLKLSIDMLRKKLAEKGIETRPGFKPASDHDYLKGKIRVEGDVANSRTLHREILSLPTFPELTNVDIDYICEALKQALEI